MYRSRGRAAGRNAQTLEDNEPMRNNASRALRMLCPRSIRFGAVGLLATAFTASAQTTPNIAEFSPSAQHSQVTNYELLVYQTGSLDPYVRVNLGKPAPQADGMIRVNFSGGFTVWPLSNTRSEARIAAHSAGGVGVSAVSNTFIYECAFSLTPRSQDVQASTSTGSIQVTGPAQCGRAADTTASWISVTSGVTGAGSGPVSYAVAANPGPSRTGVLTIAGTVFTITQAAASGSGGSGTVRYLGDLGWTSMTNGWGPVEKDRSNGEQGASDGRTITLNGRTFARGLGAHAASTIRFALSGGCSTFQAEVGVDDEVGSNGSLAFQVIGDGATLFNSGTMTGATATRSVNVSVAGVRELSLVLGDGGDGIDYDHGDWADARVACTTTPAAPSPTPAPAPTTRTTYVSDLTWTSVTNGWGPVEKDRSNGEQGSDDGRTITLGGLTYSKGLGVHAQSTVRYALNSCTRFQATVGVDDEVGSNGSVVFQVVADGATLFDSGRMTGSTAARAIDVALTGRRDLQLTVTTSGDNADYDHADWAEARITCGS